MEKRNYLLYYGIVVAKLPEIWFNSTVSDFKKEGRLMENYTSSGGDLQDYTPREIIQIVDDTLLNNDHIGPKLARLLKQIRQEAIGKVEETVK
jgi:hypothetical protein